MAATNSNFIHGNWNPVRSSSNNIFAKGGKSSKKGNSRCTSHEYPIISSKRESSLCNEVRNGGHFDEEKWFPIYSNVNPHANGNGSFMMGSRYGCQYRSNPHITFADNIDISATPEDFDNTATYDKSSCNPVRLAVTRNSNRNKRFCDGGNHSSGYSGHQQIQKWKSELTAAASGLPRKWCDFVFRRNEDNRVYRSESFRFIQKTNSLALLTPASAGVPRHKTKRIPHGVSVNDDYIDPVDHILSSPLATHNHPVVKRVWSTTSTSGDTSSGSRTSGVVSEGTSNSTHLCSEDDDRDKEEPPYHEITESYNAPYYYSDTLKEPTYINPCEDEGVAESPSVSSLSNASSPSPAFSDAVVEPVTVTVVTTNSDRATEAEDLVTSLRAPVVRKYNKLNRRSAYLRGSNRELMARKRYETAFLPSSSPHSSSQAAPDLDSLCVAIESSCKLGHGYVSKTDISQPKTTTIRSCIQDSDQHRTNTVGERACHGRQGEEHKQHDGGVEQRIIYINHPSSSSLETVEKSAEQQRTQLAPCNPVPVICFPETTIIASSNFLPQTSVSYRSSIAESVEIGSNASLETNPSISYCQQRQSHHFQHHHHPHHLHHNLNLNLLPNRTSGLCTTTNSSPLAAHKASKPMMPLSEPLPQKRYITKSNSSSGHTTTSSSSSSGPGETRRLGHNLKDNSVSSLESIDSTKSEDLPSSLHRNSSNYGSSSHHSSHYQPQKLLSPISDKSPLEPAVVLASSHQNAFDGSQDGKQNGSKWPNSSLLDELRDLPWEMPKLRRKLARIADSGISLDCSGSGSRETDCAMATHYSAGSSAAGRASLDLSVGASPTPQGGSQGQSSQFRRESSALQLSFDDGLTRDEYYEDPRYAVHEVNVAATYGPSRQGFMTASKIPGSAIVEDVTSVQVHVSHPQAQSTATSKPDRCRMKLDFNLGGTGFGGGFLGQNPANVIDASIDLERQDWFHGAITRCEAELILRATKEGSFLVRNCESTTFNRYSLSLKSFRGCIHIRIEPNSLGTFSLGDQEFPSVPHLVLHFMSHRLPIKGAEHVRLMYPVITQLL